MGTNDAIERWEDEGGGAALPPRDTKPLPPAAPLGLYQRASISRSYDSRFIPSSPRGLFAGPQEPAGAKIASRTRFVR